MMDTSHSLKYVGTWAMIYIYKCSNNQFVFLEFFWSNFSSTVDIGPEYEAVDVVHELKEVYRKWENHSSQPVPKIPGMPEGAPARAFVAPLAAGNQKQRIHKRALAKQYAGV